MRYYQAFQLRPLKAWLDRSSQVAWRDIEDALVLPYKLKGVLFSGLTINQCMLHFGPVITNSIRNFKVVEKSLGGNWKWHLNTPLWRNKNIISGNKPFVSASWSTISEMYLTQGVCVASRHCVLSIICQRHLTFCTSSYGWLIAPMGCKQTLSCRHILS